MLIKKDSTDVTRYIMIVDSSDGSPETGVTITGLDMQYTRAGASPAAKIDMAALSAIDASHGDGNDGGYGYEVDGTSSPGLYRVDWPDAAFATGVDHVILVVTGSGFSPAVEEIQLVDFDPEDAYCSAGDAITNYKLDHLIHTAENDDVVDDSVIAKMCSKDATADWSDFDNTTDSLEALRDNPPTLVRVFSGTADSGCSTTSVIVQSGDPPSGGDDDDYNNCVMAIWRGTDKTTARCNVRTISDWDDTNVTFTLHSALGFTPSSGDLVEVYMSDTEVLSEVTKLSSGFAASGASTLLGYLKALFNAAGTEPSGVGTYSCATDSLEALGTALADIKGGGFATGTDSLQAIRDYLEASVTPALATSSAMSGTGMLSDAVTLIRQMTDEPSTSPKYTNADIVSRFQSAMDVIVTDISVNTDHPILVRYNISVVDGKQSYTLPANCGGVWRVAKIISDTNTPQWEVWPNNHFQFTGNGWAIEGNTFRLHRDWDESETLEILYEPNGESYIHYGTGVPYESLRNATYRWTASGSGTNEYYMELAAGGDPSFSEPTAILVDGTDATEGTVGSLSDGEWDYGDNDTLGYNTLYIRNDNGDPDSEALHFVQSGDGTQFTLAATPTDGTLSTEDNAYGGYVLRILSDDNSIVQERVITAYTNTTQLCTLAEALDPIPQGTVTYEVVPMYSRSLLYVCCLQAAVYILAEQKEMKGVQSLTTVLEIQKRALRLKAERMQARFGHHMEGDTPDNENRGNVWGELI